MPAVSEPHFPADLIPLQYQAVMLEDEARMQPFDHAISLMVKPGMNVVDLGCGTGVLSFFAASAGAKVWSVEMLPDLAAITRNLAESNGVADNITVIEASANDFVPPEPIDVVICEMLHVGLLREKQVEVIKSFKENHRATHGDHEMTFIPDTSFQAVQPVDHDFSYHGFIAPTPLFQQATLIQERTTELGDPVVWQTVEYSADLPNTCSFDGTLSIKSNGELNALRFILKNVLAVDIENEKTIDWFMQYLIVPLERPIWVAAGDEVPVSFSYQPGDEIRALTGSLTVG